MAAVSKGMSSSLGQVVPCHAIAAPQVFLRHALRTRLLVHLVSGTSTSPVADITRINEELAFYNQALAKNHRLLQLTKSTCQKLSP
jgi:GTPase involved in cell partitioning and DNA repair